MAVMGVPCDTSAVWLLAHVEDSMFSQIIPDKWENDYSWVEMEQKSLWLHILMDRMKKIEV